jgi:hypothetical protein
MNHEQPQYRLLIGYLGSAGPYNQSSFCASVFNCRYWIIYERKHVSLTPCTLVYLDEE